ncbi:DNA polymerase III subunit delta' [Rhizobium sp. KVB221]|uniref:DNA polymerase III subunit delta n=1 Tax=Rhizobium setariae TaxID=2801340 RepID=A0A937CQE4_9HYPH|nr:DNA polymerase III subunit delta' [Rhizobium setariae]
MSNEVQSQVLDGAIAPAENTNLFGHDAAQSFLAQAYGSGKGHHAILIEGPEGIGKATLAFRFANHVLKHPEPTEAPTQMEMPDRDSPIFRQIAAGASHNVLHISRPTDPKTGKLKSIITVDEIRRAGKFFSQTSGTGNWRIVILDTADDMNRSAANAILKILEEPPRRSLFLVLSHAPGKLLPTIRSRCLPLMLRPLDEPDLIAALGHLNINVPPGQRDRVLALAGGSASQAIKLVNYGGLEILDVFDAILKQQGPAQRKAMHKLADAVTQKDHDTLYQFFLDHLGQFVTERAREAALANDINAAYALSMLQRTITDRFNISDAYNLDRKQTVLTTLGELAAAI